MRAGAVNACTPAIARGGEVLILCLPALLWTVVTAAADTASEIRALEVAHNAAPANHDVATLRWSPVAPWQTAQRAGKDFTTATALRACTCDAAVSGLPSRCR